MRLDRGGDPRKRVSLQPQPLLEFRRKPPGSGGTERPDIALTGAGFKVGGQFTGQLKTKWGVRYAVSTDSSPWSFHARLNAGSANGRLNSRLRKKIGSNVTAIPL
jgi:hypothetical protein